MKNNKRIQVILMLICMLSVFVGCTHFIGPVPERYEPEEGIWFCEELQIQLSYEKYAQTYATINGDKITCACGSDRGVRYIYVYCQETANPVYRLSEEIFSAKIISLSETELVVCDEETNVQYVFIRQE